ncbi:MAG: hypothetical protein FJW20_01690 [Acidimicrobiia bacterium]|nr:hypothetical protein [Acidimicrobiia bacterium]
MAKDADKIQIALSDTPFRSALCRMLASSASCDVICVDSPDLNSGGVLVVDTDHLGRLPHPLDQPERVVLVTHDEPGLMSKHLAEAWEAGVHSVVYDRDPISTVVLAILAARLRAAKAKPSEA